MNTNPPDLPELPTEVKDITGTLLALAETYGEAELFKFLGLLFSTDGRTEVLRSRMLLARTVVDAHGGDKRAAAEALGYWYHGGDETTGKSQTMTNFTKLLAGKTRDGRQILTDAELNR